MEDTGITKGPEPREFPLTLRGASVLISTQDDDLVETPPAIPEIHSPYGLIPGNCARWYKAESGASISPYSCLPPFLFCTIRYSTRHCLDTSNCR